MGLFSFLSKNKQDRTAEDSGRFYRAADDAAIGERARSKRASNAGEGARRSRGADPMLPEKKRARRRLVGAIALALAAAVGLPMLLDSEPKPLAGDIAIQIPSKDKAGPLPMPADPGKPVDAADSVDKGEEIVEASRPANTPPAPARPEVVAAKPADRLAVAEVRAPVKAEPVPRQEPAKVERTKAEPKLEQPKLEQPKPEHKTPPRAEQKSEPRLEPKPVEKPKAPKQEDKPVHVAAEDSARAMAILEGKQAEKSQEAASEKQVWQVAALGSAEKVAELQAKLRGAGIHSFTEKVSRGGSDLIRVKVGPYSRDEAEKVRAKISKLGI